MNLARPRILQEVIKHFGFVCCCADDWIVPSRAGFGKCVGRRQGLNRPAIHRAGERRQEAEFEKSWGRCGFDAPDGVGLAVVGDDAQAIYSFRAAAFPLLTAPVNSRG